MAFTYAFVFKKTNGIVYYHDMLSVDKNVRKALASKNRKTSIEN